LLNINQNDIKNTWENCKISKKYFLNFSFNKKNWEKKLGRTWPTVLGWAGPGPYTVGWTQPSRVGWADVPAHNQ